MSRRSNALKYEREQAMKERSRNRDRSIEERKERRLERKQQRRTSSSTGQWEPTGRTVDGLEEIAFTLPSGEVETTRLVTAATVVALSSLR